MRACVLCCAVAGLVGLTVGCKRDSEPSSKGTGRAEAGSKEKPTLAARDEAVSAYKPKLEDVDKKIDGIKRYADDVIRHFD